MLLRFTPPKTLDFLFLRIFISLFGCVGSQLQHQDLCASCGVFCCHEQAQELWQVNLVALSHVGS